MFPAFRLAYAHMRHAVSREQLGYPVNMLIVGREDEESLRPRGAYVKYPSGFGYTPFSQ